MPANVPLTDDEKKKILKFSEKGLSSRKIGVKIHRSKTTINDFLKNPSKMKQVKRLGRKSSIDRRTKSHILREASNKNVSCSQIIDNLNLKVSRWTVNRVIKRSGILKHKKKKRSPALLTRHKEARMKWAKSHMTWNKEWQKVVWSDEKKFNLDGPDGFSYYWHDLRKEEEIFTTRTMGGGSVMIWASFGWHGKSDICFVDKRFKAIDYQNMLKDHLVNFGVKMGGNEWIFQQDNVPIHKAKVNMKWFNRLKIDLMEWPSLSPDLNPIENLWGSLGRKVYANGKQYKTKEELKSAIIRSWNEIDESEYQNLIKSMPNRVFEVIKLNGAKTKY